MTVALADLEARYMDALSRIADKVGAPEAEDQTGMARVLEVATTPRLHRSNSWFLSGISGSGKSTITNILVSRGYKRIPNVVTRPRRPEESVDDNIFVTDEMFLQWEAEGKLFHPHVTNGVRHAILKSDIDALIAGSSRVFMDKSVPSVMRLIQDNPDLLQSNFVYVLPPSFTVLFQRISAREQGLARTNMLSESDILARFDEEIAQLSQSDQIPYTYVLNDAVERVESHLAPFC